jgi:hypothetical protein
LAERVEVWAGAIGACTKADIKPMTVNILNASPRISSLAAELLAKLGASANTSPYRKQYFVVLLR